MNFHFYVTVGKPPPPPQEGDNSIGETVFSVWPTQNNRRSIARQRSCKHASLTKKDGVFRGVRAVELSWRQLALRVSRFSVGDSPEKFIVEEELEGGQ
jgi:hypothetical protein